MENALHWVEEHPVIAAVIGVGGVFVLLWLLGFFSSSSSSSSSSGTNLASAYYNAEAAQTTASTQLQMATEMYGAQTAQDQIQANGAEAIAATQANMYTTLGQQSAGTTTALGEDQLLATQNSNDDALAASNTAAMYNYQIQAAGYQAGVMTTAMNTILPQQIATTGEGFVSTPYGNIGIAAGQAAATPNQLKSWGYA